MNSQSSSLAEAQNTLRVHSPRIHDAREPARTRKSLLETPLWNAPFQLLPRMSYPGQDLERVLKWQYEFSLTLPTRPRFVIATVIREGGLSDIWSLFSSVAIQSYPDVQLVIGAPSAAMRDDVRALFEEYKIPGDVFLFSPAGEDRSSSFFEHVRSYLTGQDSYAILLQPDALLHPSATFVLAKQLLKRSPDVLYTNEVVLSDDLASAQTFVRRSPLDRYSLLAQNTLGNLVVISPRATGFLAESEEAFIGSNGLRMWGIAAQLVIRDLRRAFVPLALLHSRENEISKKAASKALAEEQGPLASQLFQYAARLGFPLSELSFKTHPKNGIYGVPIPAPVEAEVQVVIPFRNQSAATIACLQSLAKQDGGLATHVTLVNNGSELAEWESVDQAARALGFAEVTHVTDEGFFNFARLNNLGALQGDEPYILFLNNDVELGSPSTLSTLKNWCAIADIGATGGLLRYPNGSIQHAGVNFLSVRPANVSQDDQFAYLTREVNAVTFAMALVKREAYRAVGGLDEFLCPNGFGDALFCLELRKKGFRSLLTPLADGVHHESLSRGRMPEELELLEMTQSGLPITDLYADFYAELQPMRLEFAGTECGDFDRIVGRIRRSPRLASKVNLISKILLWPIRLLKKI